MLLALVSVAAAVGAADAGDAASRRAVQPPRAQPVAEAVSVVRCPIPASLRTAFERAAEATSLPLALLAAVASVESGFRLDALSHVGAVGVMQVLPETAAQYGLDADRPAKNILAGASYLDDLLDDMGSADLAIAAYNAGPTVTATIATRRTARRFATSPRWMLDGAA